MNLKREQKPITFATTLAEHPMFQYAEEAFSIIDRRFPEGAGGKKDGASHLIIATRTVFTHARSVWESKNPTIIGYLRDDNGICQQVRRVNRNTQFGYWDEDNDRLQLVAITKDKQGIYYYKGERLPQRLPKAVTKQAEEEHCLPPSSHL